MQDEIQIEDTEDSESESEEELQIEEAADDSENLILEMQDDISVFSSEKIRRLRKNIKSGLRNC